MKNMSIHLTTDVVGIPQRIRSNDSINPYWLQQSMQWRILYRNNIFNSIFMCFVRFLLWTDLNVVIGDMQTCQFKMLRNHCHFLIEITYICNIWCFDGVQLKYFPWFYYFIFTKKKQIIHKFLYNSHNLLICELNFIAKPWIQNNRIDDNLSISFLWTIIPHRHKARAICF